MGLITGAVDVLVPAPCVGCGGPGPLCRPCAGAVTPAAGGPLGAPARRIMAPWAYEGAARGLVLGLKLGGSRPCGEALAAEMCRALRRAGVAADLVTWVPARRRDVRRRGFDHAEVLARAVAPALGLPARGLLVRVEDRRDQASLTRDQRRRNLLGAFRALPCGGSVLLVDDLVTTGATAAACSEALLAAGAASVEVLVACRA
jgi:predicted amidophosphoribosyltransferase